MDLRAPGGRRLGGAGHQEADAQLAEQRRAAVAAGDDRCAGRAGRAQAHAPVNLRPAVTASGHQDLIAVAGGVDRRLDGAVVLGHAPAATLGQDLRLAEAEAQPEHRRTPPLAGSAARPSFQPRAHSTVGPMPEGSKVDPKVLEAARAAFPGAGQPTTIPLGAVVHQGASHPEPLVALPLAMMNRHGLIAGATGTGKTKTLQLLAERLSAAGVPVFVSDVKGDVSGLAAPGTSNPEGRGARAADRDGLAAGGFPGGAAEPQRQAGGAAAGHGVVVRAAGAGQGAGAERHPVRACWRWCSSTATTGSCRCWISRTCARC